MKDLVLQNPALASLGAMICINPFILELMIKFICAGSGSVLGGVAFVAG